MNTFVTAQCRSTSAAGTARVKSFGPAAHWHDVAELQAAIRAVRCAADCGVRHPHSLKSCMKAALSEALQLRCGAVNQQRPALARLQALAARPGRRPCRFACPRSSPVSFSVKVSGTATSISPLPTALFISSAVRERRRRLPPKQICCRISRRQGYELPAAHICPASAGTKHRSR